nr:histidine kinase [Hydrogenophilus thiooxidans]
MLGLGIGWVVAGWQERQALIDAARTAQAAALQARTHPHFLLNSLNVIAGLLPDAPHQAERAIENLALLLQAALSDPHPWPLAAELDAARAYLALAQLRYGDRLVLDWQIDCPEAVLSQRVPRWCLVPLIENAVTHGVARRREPTTVSVTLRVTENQLTVRVGNPVAERAHLPTRSDSGFGVGLAAVTRQIAARGGTVQQVQEAGWHWVALTLPLDPRNHE